MALVYSLRYKKLNLFQKVLVEKEGEVVIERQSFRLKGKGAQDTGESIYFSDIRDLSIKDDLLSFQTLSREKFILSDFSNLFDSFLKDFMRVKNEFMADNLFMKIGMLYHEYDGHAEIINSHGKQINKGKSRIQFYEGSMVIIPEVRECFSICYDFIKSHEFDEDEYLLKISLENGSVVTISKLGTSFEDAQQTMESLLGKLYGKVVNYLKELLPEFDDVTLLKLAYKLKGGRSLQFNTLKKIDDEMPGRLLELAFQENPGAREKVDYLRSLGEDSNFYLGFSYSTRMETRDAGLKAWFFYALPEKNTVIMSLLRGAQDNGFYFFRIIMQQGDSKEKLSAKLLELDQLMILFRADTAAIHRDRRELRKSRYKAAIKKMSFFRLLRKSFLGRNTATDLDKFKDDLSKLLIEAQKLQPVSPKIIRPGQSALEAFKKSDKK